MSRPRWFCRVRAHSPFSVSAKTRCSLLSFPVSIVPFRGLVGHAALRRRRWCSRASPRSSSAASGAGTGARRAAAPPGGPEAPRGGPLVRQAQQGPEKQPRPEITVMLRSAESQSWKSNYSNDK